MWPPPRSAMPSTSSRARTIGARRLTSSARSICSTDEVWILPRRGRAALATRMSIAAGVRHQPLDRRAVAEVARDGAAARLGGERLEHVDAPRR